MPKTKSLAAKYSDPGTYQIEVLGSLRPDFSDYYNSKITVLTNNDGGAVKTTLELDVRDQTELTGLLNIFSNLRYVLLSVKMLRQEN